MKNIENLTGMKFWRQRDAAARFRPFGSPRFNARHDGVHPSIWV